MRSKGDKEIPLFDSDNDENLSSEEIRKEREALFKEAP